MKWLVYGANGWIGGQVVNLLRLQNETVIAAEARANSDKDVEKEIRETDPDRVISLIGRTHGPGYTTIDYLEQKGKLIENLTDNLYAPFVLAMTCTSLGKHLTFLNTGCIFSGYPETGYRESDSPDFFGSSYSTVKGVTDKMMSFFTDSVLTLRLRMPIDGSDSTRNFIVKIMKYRKICSMPNSMSVLPELLPVLIDLAKRKVTGIVNFVNPGMITHNEILEMVKEIYDADFTWENFSLEEQRQILLSERSNNYLNTDKLMSFYNGNDNTDNSDITISPIKVAVRKVIENMAKSKKVVRNK